MNLREAKFLFLVATLFLFGLARAGERHYYYTDPQGTVLAKTDAAGNIVETYDYRPYGTQALGVPKSGPGYTGHVNDADSGLVYMQARYYDPAIGRFLSIDPNNGSAGEIFKFGRYVYGNNNPISYIDPNGRDSQVMLASYQLGLPFVRQARHQFVYIKDMDTGRAYVARGGPDDANAIGSGSSAVASESSGAATAKNNQWLSLNPEAVMIVGRLDSAETSSDLQHNTEQVPGSATVVKGPTAALLKDINSFNSKLNGAKVPYGPTTTNSNAYAATVYEMITKKDAPVYPVLPGGDQDLRRNIDERRDDRDGGSQ